MQRNTAALADGTFDLLVIGGGAFGAAAARDAAMRGLKVAMVERSDFGAGASAECFKMVHGGIRYIQHLDVRRVRSSARERGAFLRIAPHLVTPLPIAIPTYGYGRSGKFFLGAGMYLYDLMTFDRNHDIPDRTRQIPFSRFLSRQDVLNHFPDVAAKSLTGAAVFDDGQMYNPPRLVLAFVKTAVELGAVVCNYAEATGFLREGQRVIGARVRDRLTGDEFDVRAKLTLNAAGPGAEYLLEGRSEFGSWKRGHFSRDAYFVVDRKPTSQYALAVQGQTRDKDAVLGRAARHLFVVPWRQHTLIGVWHRLFPQHPDKAYIEEEELAAWLQEINDSYPSLALKRDDVIYANCGLVPFGNDDTNTTPGEMSFGHESRYVDHRKTHGIEGLVTLIGIRYTTARGDASRALDMLLSQLPNAPRDQGTDSVPLAGGKIDNFAAFSAAAEKLRPAQVRASSWQALLRNHGTQYTQVLQHIDGDGAACIADSDTLVAEVAHAVANEMAMKLDDVVLRRTDLGSGNHPGERIVTAAAACMQKFLKWDDRKRDAEAQATLRTLSNHHATTRA